MNEHDWLAERFEAYRTHLRAVAYRMLGSLSEADDAVQEAWLRLSRSDTSGVENLGGWLTTVVARVCLDMLRARKTRREDPLDPDVSEPVRMGSQTVVSHEETLDPEHEALLADSVGLALLVVLEKLAPAERVAFVLHDLFDLPFNEIAPIVGRSPTAARQLASRARRRVQGGATGLRRLPDADYEVGGEPSGWRHHEMGREPSGERNLTRQREVVDAFLAASRGGDFAALLAVLDPDVVFRADSTAVRWGAAAEIRGAAAVANTFKGLAQAAQPALVNGSVGLIVAPRGRLRVVLQFTVVRGKIVELDAVADPARLRQLDYAVLDA